MHLAGHMCNIRSMITNTLKVIDRMQIQRSLSCLCRIHLSLGQLDQIFSKTTFILVDQILFSLNLIVFILLIVIQKVHSSVDIFAEFLGHSVHYTVALCDGKGRVIQKTLLQKIKVRLIFQVLFVILHKPAYQLLDLWNEREQHDNCCQTEDCVQKGDRYRCHRHIHKCKMYKCIHCVEDHRPHDKTKQIIDQIHKSSSLTVLICTNRRNKDRTCSTDTNTKNDWKRTCKCQDSGYRQRLKYTDCCRCALQYRGKCNTNQDTCDRIGKHSQHLDKYRALTQWGYRTTHHLHTCHQDCKTKHDISYILM